jgi:hypothetical protein
LLTKVDGELNRPIVRWHELEATQRVQEAMLTGELLR